MLQPSGEAMGLRQSGGAEEGGAGRTWGRQQEAPDDSGLYKDLREKEQECPYK